MKFLILVLAIHSATTYAKTKIGPIFDGEVNMDGSGCWLQDNKANSVFYQNTEGGFIKLNGKILSLTHVGVTKTPALECGRTFNYISRDEKNSVLIEMEKSKINNCKTKMTVTAKKEKSVWDGLKLSCAR